MRLITPYPGNSDYGVTQDGRVYRIANPRPGRVCPYELAQRPDKDGYLIIGGSKSTFKVSRMVAETFLGPAPAGETSVAHRNGILNQNNVANLRWSNYADNHADKHLHGTMPNGTKHSSAKLTEEGLVIAKARRNTGESLSSIAKDFSVSRETLGKAIRGRTWKHVAG